MTPEMIRFYSMIAVVLLGNAVLIAFLTWAHGAKSFARFRISQKPGMKVPWPARLKTMAIISVLSLCAVIGGTYALFSVLVTAEATPAWKVALQAGGLLLIYDFAYYFLHRFMHHKKVMRHVHGVHHKARNPTALESFYLHPIELFAGVGLLISMNLLIGQIHMVAFVAAFFVYSNFNIIVHSGLDIPYLPTSFLTRKHHVHHQDDFKKNFSSLTPLPDLLFGTSG